MKFATWNVNSLNVRLPHVLDWLKQTETDVLCLQETKQEDSKFPYDALKEAGYEAVHIGQKTYNGVAILSRHPLAEIQRNIPDFADEQHWRDIFAAWFINKNFSLVGGYVDLGRIAGFSEQQGYYLALEATW